VTTEPDRDCPICPRLNGFIAGWRQREPSWHNAPVPTFSAPDATVRLLIVGLAPGLRGANRTGRPFTGDYAGDLLYRTLIRYGFATGDYRARADDGVRLVATAITNAVRCVPPENRPEGAEIAACRPFLAATLARYENLRAILALGQIAHLSVVRALGLKPSQVPFGHGARSETAGLVLHASYHCSRYNTNTGRLTEAMFTAVFDALARDLAGPSGSDELAALHAPDADA